MAATLKCDTLQNASSATANITLDTAGNATVGGTYWRDQTPTLAGGEIGGQTLAMGSSFLRNRIINGDMRIDQRNAGASVSVSNGTLTYITDRWNVYEDTSGSITSQQSTTAPDGYTNSLLISVASSGSATAGQLCRLQQRIEGYNVADLAFGTNSAKSITISFWVRSSLTGTYCIGIANNALNRSIVATYSISQANIWEYKTVSVAGDTGGTWTVNTNGVGLYVSFDLGSGTDFNDTANTWSNGFYQRTTSQANWIGTASSTFYITGVQLEVGSVATPFERRQYGQELALCQRYFCKLSPTLAFSYTSTAATFNFTFPVFMRANPTASYKSGSAEMDPISGSNVTPSSVSIYYSVRDTQSALGTSSNYSGLTTPKMYWIIANAILSYFDAEL